MDAAGVDEAGKTRVLGGNPQTGPFYVEGAMPGDALAVKIRRLRLNRATAVSDDGLVFQGADHRLCPKIRRQFLPKAESRQP